MNDQDRKIAEEIREKHLWKNGLAFMNPKSGFGEIIASNMVNAMQEYAEYKCSAKDVYIKELEIQCQYAHALIKELQNAHKRS